MILITGANGHLGSTTIDHLLKKKPDAEVAGLVRSEEKGKELKEKGVDLRIGDYFDTDSLDQALEGIDVLVLISSSSFKDRVQQHKNVINAAREKGVRQIFYTSVVKAEERLSPLVFDHHDTEKAIQNSGLDYTICRNTIYLEFFPMFWGEALKKGEWAFPGGGNQQNFALRSEMGEAMTSALTDPAKHANKIYDFASTEAYTFEEYAEAMGEAAGKKIVYHDISVDDFIEHLKNVGVPDAQVNMSAVTAKLFENGGTDLTTGDMKDLLGREPQDSLEFVKNVVKSKLEEDDE